MMCPAFDYFYILPEILLSLWGGVVLLLKLFGLKDSAPAFYTVLYGQMAILLGTVYFMLHFPLHGHQNILGGLLDYSPGRGLVCLAFQFICLVLGWMTKRESQKNKKMPLEFLGILMAATVSLMLLVKSSNLASLFVSIEASSLFITLLLAMGKTSSPKAAFKFLVQSALSAGILLWGIALIYTCAGSFNYNELYHKIAAGHSLFVFAGVGLVLAALAFKLGLFPFCAWLPEIYENASWPALCFLATASKMAAAIALLQLLTGPFVPLESIYHSALIVVIVSTLIWGALSALHQNNVKRLLSLSGVVHSGFITSAILVCTFSPQAIQALGFYFMVYVAAIILIVYCLMELDHPITTLETLKDSYARSPELSIPLVLAFASLAGLPPLGGFIAKFFVFYNCILIHQWPLVVALIIASVIALYYYLQVIYSLFGRQSDLPSAPAPVTAAALPFSTRILMGFLMAALLGLGIVQGTFSLLAK